MSNDLIRKKDVLDAIKENINDFSGDLQSVLYELMDYIECLEYVYDIDSVVKSLECASYHTNGTFDEDGFSNDDAEEVIELERAIEIVKSGGVKE